MLKKQSRGHRSFLLTTEVVQSPGKYPYVACRKKNFLGLIDSEPSMTPETCTYI
jgi:hypothetical protein